MPAEKIATETVIDDHAYKRSLHMVWGAKGGSPDAPHDSWVNAGYAQVQVREDHGAHGGLTGVNLDADEIDRLIRVLKRVKRKIK